MCSNKDLSYDIEISNYRHYELEIKSGRSLSEAQNKLSRVILLIDTVTSGNAKRKYMTTFECDSYITNIFIKQKNTMIFTDYLLYSHYCQFYFKYNHNILRNSESIQVENDFNVFYYLYLAKLTSKQPYQSDCYVCVKSSPKCSIMISLMLLLCGDTGTLINPGPVYRNITGNCSLCESKIRSNIRSQCIECKAVFHKKMCYPKSFNYISM